MHLHCVNNWVKDPSCCQGEGGSNLFMGVKITSGDNTFWHRQPFHAKITSGRLEFKEYDGVTREWKQKTYYTNEFDQTVTELKDIIQRCSTGQHGNELVRKMVSYVVENGDVNTFLAPLAAGETHLGIDFYHVYRDGQLLTSIGTDEWEYTLDSSGDVFFTVAVPDLTDGIGDDEPSDPYVITIVYWVKK